MPTAAAEPPPLPEPVAAAEASEPPASSPPPRASLEERLGAHWTVWVGGIATGLGALLLVRYAAEQGYFGPGARVLLGLALAAVLLGLGEWLRRAEGALPALGSAAARANAPAALTGAGVVAAFGSVYAAHALYGFIGAGPAFLALGAVGLASLALASLHGPALAGLGLVGAEAAPLLVSSDHPSPWPVVLYLSPIAIAAYALARLRRWLWLALATAGGGFAWSFLLSGQSHGAHGLDVYHAALAALVSQAALAARRSWRLRPTAAAPTRTPASIRRRPAFSRRSPRSPSSRLFSRPTRSASTPGGSQRPARWSPLWRSPALWRRPSRRRSPSPGRWRWRRLPSGPPQRRRAHSTFMRWSPIGAGRRRSIRQASSASRSPQGSASPRSPPGDCCKANGCRRRPPSSTPARQA
jgi:hypothetical protein